MHPLSNYMRFSTYLISASVGGPVNTFNRSKVLTTRCLTASWTHLVTWDPREHTDIHDLKHYLRPSVGGCQHGNDGFLFPHECTKRKNAKPYLQPLRLPLGNLQVNKYIHTGSTADSAFLRAPTPIFRPAIYTSNV